MSFKPGDDVIVNFQGQDTPGEVISVYQSSGFILCKIHIDPELDYGGVGERLSPESTVCVRETKVVHCQHETCQLPDQKEEIDG